MRRATVYLSLHEEPNGEGGGVGLYKVGHGGGGGGGAVISSQQSQTVLNRSRRLTWSHTSHWSQGGECDGRDVRTCKI